MLNLNFFRFISIAFVLLIFSVIVFAKQNLKSDGNEIEVGIGKFYFQDSIKIVKPEDKKTDGKKSKGLNPEEVKTDKKSPEIKEVPKARPKIKPRMVTDRIKIKPVRISRPKMIKRFRPIL